MNTHGISLIEYMIAVKRKQIAELQSEIETMQANSKAGLEENVPEEITTLF